MCYGNCRKETRKQDTSIVACEYRFIAKLSLDFRTADVCAGRFVWAAGLTGEKRVFLPGETGRTGLIRQIYFLVLLCYQTGTKTDMAMSGGETRVDVNETQTRRYIVIFFFLYIWESEKSNVSVTVRTN